MWVSAALLDEVRQNPKLEIVSRPASIDFDAGGNLFPAIEEPSDVNG
jgi:hypothetical protein